jgi:Histidine kinase-, DNA gyrase B-, and HSP90-like ATPase
MAEEVLTYFAPPERDSQEQIRRDHSSLRAMALVRQLLDSFPEPAMILNRHRQIVYANDKLLALRRTGQDEIIGLRPGEMLDCIHSGEMEAGCGTSKFCTQCGAVNAIWESIKTDTAQVRECRITCRVPEGFTALDLRVWGTPLALDTTFTVFAITDITNEKRRAVLERAFFNDALDIATGIKGVLDPWPEASPSEVAEMTATACNLSGELLEEIRSYRDLLAAERGELQVNVGELDADELLRNLCDLYGRHSSAEGKTIAQPVLIGPTQIRSDPVLLSRVLGHLLKNALEASSPGEVVRVALENTGRTTFSVHNPSYMPERVQLQIFQRSFSTKAATGCGIGTYAVKLLVERYLGGEVMFTSTLHGGTQFTVRLHRQAVA